MELFTIAVLSFLESKFITQEIDGLSIKERE